MDSRTPPSRNGALYAIAAYGLWGLFPLYWKLLEGVSLVETLSHRVIWSLATIALLLAFTGGLPDFRLAFKDRAKARMLAFTALLIGVNWSLYVYAIYSHQVVQASLGYYINPLVNVWLGVAVLREKLSGPQKAAVALAGTGVLLMAWEHGTPPGLALGIAGTFAVYGLLKKRLDVPALAGLGAETLWLTPVALAALAFTWKGSPHAFFESGTTAALLIGTGAVTLAPLFFFNAAARRLRLSTLGFFQYLSPTIQLILAVVLYDEPFTPFHWAAFGFIWSALAVYTWEGISKAGAARRAA